LNFLKAVLGSIIIGLAIGWVLNLITIFNSAFTLNGELILRIIGVFLAPIGGVLGWF
jgi:hypothetical protein